MRYASLCQKVDAPQFLRVYSAGRQHDVQLHIGSNARDLENYTRNGYGENQQKRAYCVWLFTAGKGRFFLDRASYPFRRGTLLATSPGQPHPMVKSCEGGFSTSFIGFSMLGKNREALTIPFHELLSLLSGEPLSAVEFPKHTEPKVCSTFERLMDNYCSMFIPGERVRLFPANRTLMEILCLLIERVYDNEVAPHVLDDSALVRVRMEIERSYDKKLRLGELARIASLSAPYLCRAFHKEFGIAPLAYQQELRLRNAKALLMGSSMRVGEVAYAVGFQSVYHFTRLFRRSNGCTPSTYRRGK